MSERRIQALEDDAPIARRPRGYAVRRTVVLDAEGWNAMAATAPVRREVVENAPPGGRRGDGEGVPES
jgi:hypothetical protein